MVKHLYTRTHMLELYYMNYVTDMKKPKKRFVHFVLILKIQKAMKGGGGGGLKKDEDIL